MPNKGIFSQGLTVLLSRPATSDGLEELLAGFGPLHQKPASESWEISGPAIVLPYRVTPRKAAFYGTKGCMSFGT
jgi:hypothetical protein